MCSINYLYKVYYKKEWGIKMIRPLNEKLRQEAIPREITSITIDKTNRCLHHLCVTGNSSVSHINHSM